MNNNEVACWNFILSSLALLFFLSACAPRSASQGTLSVASGPRYQVSVYSGGQLIEDFERNLVHRITVSEFDLNPMIGCIVRAVAGGTDPVGLVVNEPCSSAGLRQFDVITEFGRNPATSSRDIYIFHRELAQSGASSMSISRNGSAHKLLYFIEQQR